MTFLIWVILSFSRIYWLKSNILASFSTTSVPKLKDRFAEVTGMFDPKDSLILENKSEIGEVFRQSISVQEMVRSAVQVH